MSQFILASASPQRKRLLQGIGIECVVHPSAFDESQCPEQVPQARASVLAKLKAELVASEYSEAYVLGADTLVVAADGTLCEKPADADAARAMLQLLSGSTFSVHSAVCLIAPDGTVHEGLDSTQVTFCELSSEDIEWWIGTGLWEGRSGSFQIEGPGQFFVEKLEGDWTGVVGLPVFLLGKLLQDAHYSYID